MTDIEVQKNSKEVQKLKSVELVSDQMERKKESQDFGVVAVQPLASPTERNHRQDVAFRQLDLEEPVGQSDGHPDAQLRGLETSGAGRIAETGMM